MSEKALRVYPLPAREIDTAEIHRDLQIIQPDEVQSRKQHNESRPYTIANMVASADGRTAIGGKASGIGSAVDRRVMRNLRAQVDAVMVGAGTLRAEKLSLGLDVGTEGSQPIAIIATASGELPLGDNLVSHAGQRLVLISTRPNIVAIVESQNEDTEVLVVSATEEGYPDLTQALRSLKRDLGVGRLLIEGGSKLNRALISRGLLDELFLTIAPRLLGGGAPEEIRTIVEGDLTAPETLRLLSVHVASDEIFLRYALSGISHSS